VGIILTWRVIAIFRVTGRPDSAVNGSDCEDSTEFGESKVLSEIVIRPLVEAR
jgi:hypothetical protein